MITAVLAGADPVRHAGQLAALLLLYVDALGDAGHRDRRLHHRDHARPRAGRGELGADRARTGARASSAARCWSGSRPAAAGTPRFSRARRCCGALAVATLVLPSPSASTAAPARRLGEPIRALLARPGIWAVVAVRPAVQARHLGDGADDEAVLGGERILAGADRGAHHGPAAGHARRGRARRASSRRGSGSSTRCGRWGWCSCSRVWATRRRRLPGAGKIGRSSAAALFENFAAGLGTAAFLAFLMSVCERRYAATQFALLSAVFALSRMLVGLPSGTMVEQLGYARLLLPDVPDGVAGLPAPPTHPARVHRRVSSPGHGHGAVRLSRCLAPWP